MDLNQTYVGIQGIVQQPSISLVRVKTLVKIRKCFNMTRSEEGEALWYFAAKVWHIRTVSRATMVNSLHMLRFSVLSKFTSTFLQQQNNRRKGDQTWLHPQSRTLSTHLELDILDRISVEREQSCVLAWHCWCHVCSAKAQLVLAADSHSSDRESTAASSLTAASM